MTPCATESTVVLLILAAALCGGFIGYLCGGFIGYLCARVRQAPRQHHDEHEDFPGC